jgi:hypothetical protein
MLFPCDARGERDGCANGTVEVLLSDIDSVRAAPGILPPAVLADPCVSSIDVRQASMCVKHR